MQERIKLRFLPVNPKLSELAKHTVVLEAVGSNM
ncbi:uncharacterized protein PITG_08924 [Phytophthora infestans T30-4]|uniref:Uncharacterized protein n=1 Tax=Phytophthora infestans (strain T30-4) TaxID=403677 RepID=D0NDI3_PHYIT|nr:uncharacterized protein PITG_08924 [Phytophthora infestans T30-4]EEY56140.1 hypothetical protein PITG_08924 [Phytophthora infestans T30-4]|eukprot:XP_002902970.1 hypothetical protein PITG_08924 [Phytophthora infestans T30-4]